MQFRKALNYKVIFPLETKIIIVVGIGDRPLLVATGPGKAFHWEKEQVCLWERKNADFIYFKSLHMCLGKKGRKFQKNVLGVVRSWSSTNCRKQSPRFSTWFLFFFSISSSKGFQTWGNFRTERNCSRSQAMKGKKNLEPQVLSINLGQTWEFGGMTHRGQSSERLRDTSPICLFSTRIFLQNSVS